MKTIKPPKSKLIPYTGMNEVNNLLNKGYLIEKLFESSNDSTSYFYLVEYVDEELEEV